MRFFYNSLLCVVAILYTPIHLIRLCFSNKYRNSTFARMGFQAIPGLNSDAPRYWIHSVSVGETQVAKTLTSELLRREPNAQIVISTITETGQAVARKIEGTSGTFYYPLDLSILVTPMLRKIDPQAVFIVETDIWYNFVNGAMRRDIPVYLVNGKMSETTLKRYKQFPKLAAMLLKPFHHFFVQSETYKERFLESGISENSLTIAGNVKLDCDVPQLSDDEKKELSTKYLIDLSKPIITFGSTHAGEEELAVSVYKTLKEKFKDLQVFLVPRHPERFNSVAEMLKKESIDFNRASQMSDQHRDFVLVDQMGVLMKLYSISTIGVVAGTFTPHVGGHNILEPSFYGKPFVYGPWIYKQPGFHQMNLEAKAGIQCKPEELAEELEKLLSDQSLCDEYGKRGKEILEVSKGATEKIVNEVFAELNKNV
ncbi:MAG: hypothetical protein NE327_19560 [Lentisphaeraceae bacterium]|nr:hypothetical protein [Lentisphaeraceae bacterium]